MKTMKKAVAGMLVVCVAALGMPLTASAGIVTTEQAAAPASSTARAHVNEFLARADVQATMRNQGLDADAARARVDAMTDQEVTALAGRIDQAPAGGDILGVVFTIFVILLITDILGLTKVFPFTRSVR